MFYFLCSRGRATVSVAPSALLFFFYETTHGWRRGLHSVAASRLGITYKYRSRSSVMWWATCPGMM